MAHVINLSGFHHHALTPFIDVFTPATSADVSRLEELINQHHHALMERLQTQGAIVFRDFKPVGVDHFEDFVEDTLQLNAWNAFNSKGTPKAVANWLRAWSEKIFGAGDYRRYLGSSTVQLGPVENSVQGPHVEGGGLIRRSRFLALYCEQPGLERAETGMADFSSVYNRLPAALQQKMREGWNEYKYTSSQKLGLIDRLLLKLSPMEYELRDDGYALIKGSPCPAACVVPGNGDIAVQPWAFSRNANPQVLKAAQEIFTGRGELTTDSTADALNMFWDIINDDGESMGWSEQEQLTLFRTIFAEAHLMDWKQGDVALLDNVRMGHWRMDGVQGNRQLIQIQSAPIDVREFKVRDGEDLEGVPA